MTDVKAFHHEGHESGNGGFVRQRFGQLATMNLLWIIIIVLVVLALVGGIGVRGRR
jgi:uncharacterized membrane protein